MRHSRRRDLEAIGRLRREDVAASKAYDADALAALWTRDGVMLAPGLAPVRGRARIRALLQNAASQGAKVISYRETFEETLLFGEWALEWGDVVGSERLRPGERPTRTTFRVMRLLRRTPDGMWRVHRSMFHEAPPIPRRRKWPGR